MSSDGEVYIMRGDGDEDWVSPTPARTAVTDALAAATDVEADELDDLDAYVDLDDLRAVLDADDDALSFDVEGHDVTVHSDGDIAVAD